MSPDISQSVYGGRPLRAIVPARVEDGDQVHSDERLIIDLGTRAWEVKTALVSETVALLLSGASSSIVATVILDHAKGFVHYLTLMTVVVARRMCGRWRTPI